MTFASQMRTLRILRGLTQPDLEKATGVPVNIISCIETGKVLPINDWEARIKEALSWPADDSAFAALGATNGTTQPAPQPATS
jgi:transcriptional regulator with XRE-family HTH domain